MASGSFSPTARAFAQARHTARGTPARERRSYAPVSARGHAFMLRIERPIWRLVGLPVHLTREGTSTAQPGHNHSGSSLVGGFKWRWTS